MKSCTISDCQKTYKWGKYCPMHAKRLRLYGDPLVTKFPNHGHVDTSEYRSWKDMKARCLTKTNKNYQYYGGRGIKVCDRWKNSFMAFYEDMGKKPTLKYTIERINNNGNYEPSNCKWATRTEQANNKRNNRLLTNDNITKTVAEWSRFLDIPTTTIIWRLNRNKTEKESLYVN